LSDARARVEPGTAQSWAKRRDQPLGPSPAGRLGGPQRIPRPGLVTPGPEPWWAPHPPLHASIAQVRAAFAADGIERPAGAEGGRPSTHVLPSIDPRPAAVLCALWDEDGQATVLLTRRSRRLRSHTGEVSFPGGRLDAGESAVSAALREADEEVGLDPSQVEVIGRLHPLATLSSAVAIEPFVAVLAGRPDLRPNPMEVDHAFGVTLVELMAPGVYHEERWDVGDGIERPVHFFDLPGDTVWGATARLLRDLIDVVASPPAPAI
jgi:8-oxo-dGTP pyrophosphatase MutT (NUDIX family)